MQQELEKLPSLINCLLLELDHLNSDPFFLSKMGVSVYLDTVLVPLSLLLIMGYHAYLWRIFKSNPSLTTIGADRRRRSLWILSIEQDNEKKGMLAVQSLRNCLMNTILAALVAVVLNSSLAALANNSYNATHLLNKICGTQSGRTLVVKYGLASLFLLISFLCSSMAVGCLTEANFLINVSSAIPHAYLEAIFERGFTLALIGNRALCITFPLWLWMFGAVPVALSSVALIWVLYGLDFAGSGLR